MPIEITTKENINGHCILDFDIKKNDGAPGPESKPHNNLLFYIGFYQFEEYQ
jgi:hypothetical protein